MAGRAGRAKDAGEPAGERPAWEALVASDALQRLASGPHGLTPDEAERRLKETGPNVLPRSKPPAFALLFLRQFASPLIAILGAAGVFAAAIGEYVDAGFIAGVLVLNATIGSIQEWRAERGAQALQRLLQIIATVERGGEARSIAAAALVPGDLVHLEPGQSVPADIRLVHSHALEVDESLLTGESLPAGKDAAWIAPGPTPMADRRNMSHAGTLVIRGRATGVVVATGARTEVGRIASDLTSGSRTEAPLLIRMRRFARVVGLAVLAAATLLAAIGVLRGEPLREMVLFAVAAAVSAVPEGLPVALTIALAVGAGRMARRRVIVRRLAAVEGLGSCTLVATDKTGTLTMNALTVREVRTVDGGLYTVSGEGFEPAGEVRHGAEDVRAGTDPGLDELARAVLLCNEATLLHPSEPGGPWGWSGDPTDVALLTFAAKLGLHAETEGDDAPLVNDIPFEPERRFAATVHARDDVGVLYVKGAPERVLPMCDNLEPTRYMAEANTMAASGLRVLAVATGWADPDPGSPLSEPKALRFLGFVGMMDPPRPGVPEAISAAHAAGLHVMMVTGDHPTTAAAIAAAVHIPVEDGGILTGADLEDLSDEELQDRVRDVTVFARVAPHQKLQIVQAAEAGGHFVAVTGDGVNDAPALRAAHIGVAMGKSGTDVAREAADIVLTDDAFPSVVAGIEEGRVAYGNVRNVVFLLVSTGAAELVLLLLALSTGSPLPLLPAQLLWLNLVTNGIQDVALGMEPAKGDELEQPPRHPRERIFDRLMIERTLVGAVVMGFGAFFVFRWLLDAGWEVPAARNLVLLLMVLYENLHVGNSRAERRSAFTLSPLRNPFLLWGAVVAQLLHIATLYIPFMQRILRTEPVSFTTWAALLGIALSITVAFEVHKAIRRRWPVTRRRWTEGA